MQLDWFTVVAQICNFLLLLWLLKRFLYRPILDAMAARQQRIATALTEAQSKAATAEALQRDYLARQQELAASREIWLAQVQEEVAAQRQTWQAEARAEVDAQRARWQAELQCDQEDFHRTLQREAGQRLLALARRTLGDLANAELEAQAVSVLLTRLDSLDDKTAQVLAEAAEDGCTIVTAFPLPEAQRQMLTAALRQFLSPGLNPDFRNDSGAPWGITLETPSQRLSWTLDSYLDGFTSEWRALTPPARSTAP